MTDGTFDVQDETCRENEAATEWQPVGPGTPCGVYLETKREGESGTNVCFCRILCLGDEPEWIERGRVSQITDAPMSGRTTITHSTFLAPTHWRWPST